MCVGYINCGSGIPAAISSGIAAGMPLLRIGETLFLFLYLYLYLSLVSTCRKDSRRLVLAAEEEIRAADVLAAQKPAGGRHGEGRLVVHL